MVNARTVNDSDRTAVGLRGAGYRVTPQRLAVHRALVDLDRHAGAEEVLEAVKDELPTVSLPTVYASLDALEDAGLIRRVTAARGPARFDPRPPDHHHLVCRRCGTVDDVDADVGLDPALRSAARRGFAPDAAQVVVHGLCARCAKSNV